MRKKFVLPTSLLALLLFVACNDQAKTTETETRTLVGTWIPVDVQGTELSDKDRKEILEGGYMEFEKGGTFTIHSKEGTQSRTGLFNYDEKTKKLKLISGEEEKNYSIDWVGNNNLVLIVPDENIRISFNKRKGSGFPGIDKIDHEGDADRDEKKSTGIVGTWKPVHVDYQDMSEEEKNRVLNGTTVEFTNGGSYISISTEETEYGKYFLEQDKLRLESNGKTHILTIETLGPDRMILRDEKGSVTVERKN